MEIYPQATIGFLDGSTLQNKPNLHRMLDTKNWTYHMDSTKRNQPFFGFMALNGNDCLEAIHKATHKEVIAFMQSIRQLNCHNEPIGIILDNAKIHKAKELQKVCWDLDIHLLFLPPYSPKYNPIEFLWKDGKKILAKTPNFEDAKNLAPPVFLELMKERKHSYARAWKDKFLSANCN